MDRQFSEKHRDINLELRALRNCFIPHDQNSHALKVVTIVLVVSWAIITIGIAFGWAVPTVQYGILSAAVWTYVGRMWGIEIELLSGTVTLGDDGPEDE